MMDRVVFVDLTRLTTGIVVFLLYLAVMAGVERVLRRSVLAQEAKVKILALADFVLWSACLV